MILKIVLAILGWLKGNALGLATFAVGLWVAWGIYHRQKRADEKAREKLGTIVAEMVLLILSEITGRPAAPEVEARVRRLAKGIIDQVIQLPTLRGGGTLPAGPAGTIVTTQAQATYGYASGKPEIGEHSSGGKTP
jgi:hypothetical protein